MLCQIRGLLDIGITLYFLDISQKLHRVKSDGRIGKSHIKLIAGRVAAKKVLRKVLIACITTIGKLVLKWLAIENANHTPHRLCLIVLDGEFEFHLCHIKAPSLLSLGYTSQISARNSLLRCHLPWNYRGIQHRMDGSWQSAS